MCSCKTSYKRSTHEALVHAEFMSCESTAVGRAAIINLQTKHEDNLFFPRIMVAHYSYSPALWQPHE